jgi:hypothetical protein
MILVSSGEFRSSVRKLLKEATVAASNINEHCTLLDTVFLRRREVAPQA